LNKGQILDRAVCAEFSATKMKMDRKGWKPFLLAEIKDLIGEQTTQAKKEALLALLNEFQDCFATELSELGESKFGSVEIKLENLEPVTYWPYRLSYAEQEFVKEHIKELEA